MVPDVKIIVRIVLFAALAVSLVIGPSASLQAAQILTDELGRSVTISETPLRLIGLAPSLTETLFALGVGNRLVGATDWADYPPEAANLPRVGSFVAPNVEQIVSLRPDLVLAEREGNPPQVVERLENAGLAVYVTRSDDPLTLPDQWMRLGEILGVPENGRKLAVGFRTRLEEIRKKIQGAKKVKTLLVVGQDPLISTGPDTMLGRLLELMGAENVAAGAPGQWPQLSLEYVLEVKPELVVIMTMEAVPQVEKQVQYWKEMPGLKDLSDYRVGTIDADLIARPGPRLGVGTLELARLIHPGLFSEEKRDP